MARSEIIGPDNDFAGPNTRDETPGGGWSWKRTVAALNTMFEELYSLATAAATTVSLNALAARNPNDIGTSEEIATNGDEATALSLSVYQSIITTGGSEGAEEATIGDGTGVTVGQRKLVTLETLTEATDSVTLDDANFSQGSDTITGITLDAAGEFVLAEWRGASWEIIAASAGVVATSG